MPIISNYFKIDFCYLNEEKILYYLHLKVIKNNNIKSINLLIKWFFNIIIFKNIIKLLQ